MEKILPLFPLSLVVYPQEKLNLHIFEPRYKQLVQDCESNQGTFGIPVYINEQVAEYGTEVELVHIERIYEDGRMDIKTKGIQVFKMITFDNPLKNHLYAGGLVQVMEVDYEIAPEITKKLLEQLTELYKVLQIEADFKLIDQKKLSYEVAHKIGLSTEQEYELLKLSSEKDRQSYLSAHLEKAIPIISEMEKTKQLIRMNGHFKHFDPLNF